MNHIFISYRRDDARDVTGRIYDRLKARFGEGAIFTDVDKIPLGIDFRIKLDENVSQCKIFLAVIGDKWLSAKDAEGRPRLNDPMDFVRIEIESALERNIPVIPLLVQGTQMPSADQLPESIKELAFRNGTPIRHDPDFHKDMTRLIDSVEQYLGQAEKKIWEEAKNSDSVESYDDYLVCFPAGKFTHDAEERIRSLKLKQGHKLPTGAGGANRDLISEPFEENATPMAPANRYGVIVKQMTLMLIILEFVALGVFFVSEVNAVRFASVILPSLVGIGLIITGVIRRRITEIALGIAGGIAPWLLVSFVGAMETIGITVVIVLVLGIFVLKDLRGITVKGIKSFKSTN